jgi:hypothetical protein
MEELRREGVFRMSTERWKSYLDFLNLESMIIKTAKVGTYYPALPHFLW